MQVGVLQGAGVSLKNIKLGCKLVKSEPSVWNFWQVCVNKYQQG